LSDFTFNDFFIIYYEANNICIFEQKEFTKNICKYPYDYSLYAIVNEAASLKNSSNKILNEISSELLFSNLDSILNKWIRDKSDGYELILVFLKSHDEKFIFLGGLEREGGEVLDLIDCRMHKEISTYKKITADSKNNNLLNLYINKVNGNIKSSTNTSCSNFFFFELLRSVGINIPLILVQNMLERNIVTHYFVDKEKIFYDELNNSISIDYSTSRIYIDLDETLIWSHVNMPIIEMVNFLNNLYHNKFLITLVTRHKKSIPKTLSSVSIDINIFDDIISVHSSQDKSQFIENDGIFIDNEFPERLDVRTKKNITVLDLDQIDFLRI